MRCQKLCLPLLLALLLGSCRNKEAKGSGDLEMTLERLSASKAKTPQDVQPYDEALAWHEYKVLKVINGDVKAPVVRVAHWTVLNAKPVTVSETAGEVTTVKLAPYEGVRGLKDVAASDTLDFTEDVPRFLDLTQSRTVAVTPSVMRMDYGGFVSEQMILYWKLRAQLRLVVMGHSHAAKGIAPRYFFNPENRETPVAFNLAPAGSSMHLQSTMIREYVMALPKVEWVVWVASPRLFNEVIDDSRKEEDFLGSPGWRYDQQHKARLWPVPSDAKPVPLDQLDLDELEVSNVDSWGWEGRMRTIIPAEEQEARSGLLETMAKVDFKFSESRWEEFAETVRDLNRRHVRVLLLITPIHPVVKDSRGADPDGTGHSDYEKIVKKLEALDAELPLTWFQDFNRDGHHDHEHEEFYDADHLNRIGAHKLTKRIVAWLEECEKGNTP